jgi:hypothetical protein
LLDWVNIVTVATANLATLGLTSSDISGLQGGGSDLSANVDAVHGLKAQIAAQYSDKTANKQYIGDAARLMIKKIDGTPTVPDSLKIQLGIPVPSGIINRTPPVTPASLLATPYADGFNALKWHNAGNKPTTQYLVLAKPVATPSNALMDDGWAIVGTTTRAAFTHMGVTPGAPMAYRVMAARAGNISNPSLPATV